MLPFLVAFLLGSDVSVPTESLASTQPPVDQAMLNDVESAARDYRLQVYETFRTDRPEFDQRYQAGRHVYAAWRGAGAQPQNASAVVDWYREATVASRHDVRQSLPTQPEFQRAFVTPATPTPPASDSTLEAAQESDSVVGPAAPAIEPVAPLTEPAAPTATVKLPALEPAPAIDSTTSDASPIPTGPIVLPVHAAPDTSPVDPWGAMFDSHESTNDLSATPSARPSDAEDVEFPTLDELFHGSSAGQKR